MRLCRSQGEWAVKGRCGFRNRSASQTVPRTRIRFWFRSSGSGPSLPFNVFSREAAAAGLRLPLAVVRATLSLSAVPLRQHLFLVLRSHIHWFPSDCPIADASRGVLGEAPELNGSEPRSD